MFAKQRKELIFWLASDQVVLPLIYLRLGIASFITDLQPARQRLCGKVGDANLRRVALMSTLPFSKDKMDGNETEAKIQ